MEHVKRNLILTAFAVMNAAVFGVTFLTDRMIFTFPDRTDERFAVAVTDYIICRVIALAVTVAVFYGIYIIIFDRSGRGKGLIEVIKCGCVYLPVMLAVMVIKLPAGFLTNDEYSIYNDAVGLVHDTWFNFMTVYYYIVSLMLIPFKYGPIIMKVIIEFFVVGYTVYRTKEHFGKKIGNLMYVLFLLYPVIAYTTSAHRLPVYFLIYLAMFVKLIYDRAGKKDPTFGGLAFLLISGAVLTQWRTEGIYLLVLVPIVIFMTYPSLRSRKAFLVIGAYVIIQYLLWIPQNGAVSTGLDGAANDRMKPFYAYTITNMFRNGLDTEKNAEDLAIVDRYISLESIDKINEHYGDINYEDVLILYADGFVGVRPEADNGDFVAYSDALKRIFVNNPDVLLRTRWGAFRYAALPFHITYTGMGLRELVSFFVSIVKTVAYNLFIPVIFAAGALVYSLIRRKWFWFFVYGGLLCHLFIVFVLAPASYFKYYFPVYIMSYFCMIGIVTGLICKKNGIIPQGDK